MYHDYKKQAPKTQIADPEDTPEKRAHYNALMAAYRVADNSESIKCMVIRVFQRTGRWKLGAPTWADFCVNILKKSVRTIERSTAIGGRVWNVLGDDPFIAVIKKQLEGPPMKTALPVAPGAQYDKSVAKCNTYVTFDPSAIPEIESPLLEFVNEKKCMAKLAGAVHTQHKAIAAEVVRRGDLSAKATDKVIDEFGARKPKKTTKPKKAEVETTGSPVDAFRLILRQVAAHFLGLADLTDGEVQKSANGVYPYCRKVSQGAKLLTRGATNVR